MTGNAGGLLPPVFLKLIWRHKNTGGKTAGVTGIPPLSRRRRLLFVGGELRAVGLVAGAAHQAEGELFAQFHAFLVEGVDVLTARP